MTRLVDAIESIVDRLRIVRRSIVYFTMGLTAYVTVKSFELATTSEMDPLGMAAVIGAITVPAGYFAQAVATAYFQMRRDVELR